jgi:hypothetical protein
MNDDSELAKYLADYIMEEWAREYEKTDEFAFTVDNFLNNMTETVTNGIEAYRGGANES